MIRLHRCTNIADFEAARGLIAIMEDWDLEQTQARGIATQALVEAYYGKTAAALRSQFTASDAGFFLAFADDAAAGCAGFCGSGNGTGEIQKLFVQPEFRGKGIARALMATVLDEVKQKGYSRIRLETAVFMTDAIALYGAFGFQRCQPFHAPPAGLDSIMVYMERPL